MRQTTNSPSLRRDWLPVLTPVWDPVAELLVVHGGQTLLCGRGHDCDLPIPLSGGADRHCEFEFPRGALILVNAYSTVWVNNVPVRAGASIVPGDDVTIGSATFRVERLVLKPQDLRFTSPSAEFLSAAIQTRDAHDDTDGAVSDWLQVWNDSLQHRSDDLSQQVRRRDEKLNELFEFRREYQWRARELEEAQELLRAERSSLEAARSQLQSDQTSLQSRTAALEKQQRKLSQIAQQQQATLESQKLEFQERKNHTQNAEESLRQRLAECEFREESLRAQFEQQEKVVEALQQRQSQLDECAASLDAQRESLIAQSIELDSINEGRAELECQRQEISQQQDTIYDKSAELAQLESELKVWSDSREQEEELLRQVESLQQEISAAAEYRNSYWNDLEVSLSEQKALVQQLTEQLQVATWELGEAQAARSRIAELETLEHRLTKQEGINQELTEQLHVATLTLKEIQAAESTAAERLATASDELQERDQLIGDTAVPTTETAATPSRMDPVCWPPTPMKQTRNPPHNSCLPPAGNRGLLQEIGSPASQIRKWC